MNLFSRNRCPAARECGGVGGGPWLAGAGKVEGAGRGGMRRGRGAHRVRGGVLWMSFQIAHGVNNPKRDGSERLPIRPWRLAKRASRGSGSSVQKASAFGAPEGAPSRPLGGH